MKNATEQLAQYACYHRNRKNVATHLIGIPLIVLALVTLLSRPEFTLFSVALSPAVVVALAAVIYYVRLDFGLGFLMAVLLALCVWAGQSIAAMPTTSWLVISIGMFIVGWIFQFVGHFFEGRKPAFVDDVIGLVIGPLFVVAEVVFMLGMRKQLNREVEEKVIQLMQDMPPVNSRSAA